MTEDSINNNNGIEIHAATEKSAKQQEQLLPLPLLLSERMKAATKDVHDQSDKKVNIKLAIVLTSKELYAEAISLFWPIYRELEAALEKHKDHEQLKLLYPMLKILRRASRFEADMKYLVGNDKIKAEQIMNRRIKCHYNHKKSNDNDNNDDNTNGNISSNNNDKMVVNDEVVFHPPELQEYIDTLRHFSKTNPILLIPYIFAMYGAITAGGYMIKRMVKTAFRLPSTSSTTTSDSDENNNNNNNKGVTMFVIELENTKFSSPKALLNEMKRILNEDMELTIEEEDSILKEAPRVFIRNNALIETVKDTPIFGTILNRFWWCCCFAGIVAFTMAIVATTYYYYYYYSKSTVEK